MGDWTYEIEIPGQEAKGTIDLAQNGSSLAGSMKSSDGNSYELQNPVLKNNEFTFTINVDRNGTSIKVDIKLTVTGEEFAGTVTVSGYGSFDLEGERTSNPE